MKKSLRIAWVLLLAALLTVPALADSGPKAQLIVRVENGPEELYYLDLLAEGSPAGGSYDGLSWSYSDGEIAALNQDLLDALRSAVPDGWHACTVQGSSGAPISGQLEPDEQGFHAFGYHGVPETYRILIVTESGESWVSGVCTRKVLQSSATVDWAAKTVSTPPVWLGYVLQFLSTLLPTLLIEGLLLVLFGFSLRKNWKPFLLVNLVTQGALAAYMASVVLRHGVSGWSMLFFPPIELVITLAETLLYRRLLAGQSSWRAAAYGVFANICSAALGLVIMEPVWRFVVSIS